MERNRWKLMVIVGAPSGLAAAIRLKQLAAEAGRDIEVTILEKFGGWRAYSFGLDPRALNELIPDWQEKEHRSTPCEGREVSYLERGRWSVAADIYVAARS